MTPQRSDPPAEVVLAAADLAGEARYHEAQQRRFAEETQSTADQHRSDADSYAAEADAIEAWLDSVSAGWRDRDAPARKAKA